MYEEEKTMKKKVYVFMMICICLLGLIACNNDTSKSLEGWGDAHWIWTDDSSTENTWADFRRDFVLEEVPNKANIKIACDNKYWLYVNEELVVLDGGLNRGPNESDTYYDEIDIVQYLKAGNNNISILVWYWGSTDGSTHYITSGKAGLIVSTELEENGKAIETGDGNWFAKVDAAYKQDVERTNFFLGEYGVVFDGKESVAWTGAEFAPEENGWEKAVVVGEDEQDPGYAGDAPWNNLVKRPTPLIKDYGLTELSLSETDISHNENGETVYTVTLPYNMQISPYIKLGETTEAGKEITAYTDTYNMSTLNMTYITTNGEQSYENKPWISGDHLYFVVPEGVEVTALGYRQSGYAVEAGKDTLFTGYFDSSISENHVTNALFTGGHTWTQSEVSTDNNFYDELWNKALYTLYVCMRDSYMDCPDRERGQYIGDVINEMEEAFYALGPSANGLSAKAIRETCAGQIEYKYKGKTYYAMSCVEPIEEVHEIPIQELGTAVAAWKYYLYTGDASVPQDCFTALYNYLTNYDYETEGAYVDTIRMREEKELKQTYNIRMSHLGKWTDWGNNQDARVAVNCWWYMSAVAVRNMADIEGVNATAEQIKNLDENIAKVESNFQKFWNEDLNAYASTYDDTWQKSAEYSDGTHLVDDRVNALAVVAGLVDESKYEAIRNVFMGTDTTPAYKNASIYMERYVYEALYKMGYASDAMSRMQERFMDIVNDTTSSTLPEVWLGNNVVNDSGTKNHGWSGGALIAMSHHASGIEPVSAGYESWIVCPQLGDFESFSVCVPSEIGEIKETVTRNENGLEMTITSPGGKAEIWVPIIEGQQVIVSSENAKLLEERMKYNQTYIVYEINEAGEYSFIVQ